MHKKANAPKNSKEAVSNWQASYPEVNQRDVSADCKLC